MAALVKIGNSRGVRIPKAIIEQAKLEGKEIEFEVREEGLLLRPVNRAPREGWAENVRETMARYGKEDPGVLEDWAREPMEDWEW
jgi:antitoxin MazE